MRTTVTLDPDVEALIRSAMQQRALSFKDALNSAVRTGLAARQPGGRSFRQRSLSLGAEQNFRWDKALAVAEAMEDEEVAHKLILRK